MEVFFLAIIIVGAAVAGIGIKMFFKPGGMFTRTCGSSFDPKTGKPMKCTSCQDNSPEDCKNDEEQNKEQDKEQENAAK